MKTVYKYPIDPSDYYFTIELPEGARVLCVQSQQDEPMIWALVDPGAKSEKRRFLMAGTGQPIKEQSQLGQYVGTFQLRHGSLVFHVWEMA